MFGNNKDVNYNLGNQVQMLGKVWKHWVSFEVQN